MHVVLTPDWEQGIHDLAERIMQELQSGNNVLWLLSGGSNVAASVKIMNQIPTELSRQLSISLVDERFGPVGHQNSNWTKIMDSGFQPKDAKLQPVILEGATFEESQQHFEKIVSDALSLNSRIFAQFGIGDDGHIAGILPNSISTKETESLVVGYHSATFIRLSLSFTAIIHLTAGYAFAFGSEKNHALHSLIRENLSVVDQPAQILKQMREAYVYNDQVGG